MMAPPFCQIELFADDRGWVALKKFTDKGRYKEREYLLESDKEAVDEEEILKTAKDRFDVKDEDIEVQT